MKADTNPFRYCGEYFDEETGFVYLRARYYSPDIGRFVSEDPIKDGNNWYVYCGNNPVNYTDRHGLSIQIIGYDQLESDIRFLELQKLTSDKLQIDAFGIVTYNNSSFTSNELKVGSSLIRELIDSSIPITIELTNYSGSGEIGYYKDGQLCGIKVNLDPFEKNVLTSKALFDEGTEYLEFPTQIVLGHELIHAIREIKGINIDYQLKGLVEYTAPNGNKYVEESRIEELETVGLEYYSYVNIIHKYSRRNNYYTENALRKEQRCNERVRYLTPAD